MASTPSITNKPFWVAEGQQWTPGQTQAQYEQSGGQLAGGVASVLTPVKPATPVPTGSVITTETDPYKLYTSYKNAGGALDMVGWEQAGRPGSAAPATKSSTLGDIFGGLYANDPNADAIAKAQKDATSGYTQGAPDQNDTYQNALNQYQDEIDAITNLFASRKADITKQYTDLGKSRLGSEAAILARSGMAGSTFGSAATSKLQTANQQELESAQSKVDAEKAAAISQLMGAVRAQASKDYTDRLNAYTSGADKTVQYLRDSAARNDANTTNVAQSAILKGIDLADPKNGQIVSNIAQAMGIDPATIINKYQQAKATYDAAQAKLKQDNTKAAADLAKVIADTNATTASIAKTKAETSKIYNDINTGGTYQSAGLKIGKSDLSDIQSVLEKGNTQKGLGGKGNDGYANTTTYITLYNYWTGQGGLAKDFTSLFPPKTYLNPNDPTLPDQLKNALNSTAINLVIPGVGQ